MYLGGRLPVVKRIARRDLFLVVNVAHVYNAAEQEGLLFVSRGEDGRDGIEADEARQRGARRWDLRYDICDFERHQGRCRSGDDAGTLSAPWPGAVVVIIVGRRRLGFAVAVRMETEEGRWPSGGTKYAGRLELTISVVEANPLMSGCGYVSTHIGQNGSGGFPSPRALEG